MFKKILKVFSTLILLLLGILFLAYWLVPPLTRSFADTDTLQKKLVTRMLPSDQPGRIRLDKEQKRIFRMLNLRTYLGTAGETLLELPSLLYRYETIRPRYRRISPDALGIFVDPAKNDPDRILSALRELGVHSVGLRIYATPGYLDSAAYRKDLAFARILHDKGYHLLLVPAQLFESFRGNLQKIWSRIVKDFAPYADFYQIGEAVNRSKWGVGTPEHYRAFVDAAFDAIRRYDPTAKTLGPGVIDFEWFYTLYFDALADHRFDIQASLLYVDRVRQPENEQNGFDTEAKIRLFKAIAPDKPLWITEVNWPLTGTGAYKPTSNKEAVSPDKYRDYMVRYLIIALASGYVDRVYWWQLFARGYGLADHLSPRHYPAFGAFAVLEKELTGSIPEGHDLQGGLYDYRFRKGGTTLHAFWTKDAQSRPLPTGHAYRCRDLNATPLPSIRRAGPTPIFCEERP